MQVFLENLAQFADDFVHALPVAPATGAHIVGLKGDLGAGKTTFVQHVARALGVRESVTSPTFVIMQKYGTTHPVFTTLVHIDAYRLSSAEAGTIGWEETLKDPHALVVVEWPEMLGEHFPKNVPTLVFSVQGETARTIEHAS